MVDVEIHPQCLKEQESEQHPEDGPKETEFDRGFQKYPWTDPESVA
jgi:hypothetical protein